MIKAMFSFKTIFAASALALACASGYAQLRASPSLSLPRIAPGDTTQRQADYIVAIVNSEPVTNNEVRTRVLRMEQQLSQRGGALPPREEITTQVLERLISERAQVQLARENGIKIDDAAVDNGVLTVARQNQVDAPELRKRLEADGISWNQFRADLRDELLLTRVREREVEARITITDQELSSFIREQQDGPDASSIEINLAQILVVVPEAANAAQVQALQNRATRAAQRARSGEDFSGLVKEFSDAPDSSNGGQLGMRPADRYPTLFVEATQTLRTGGIAGPVRSDAGFHVLKVIEKKQTSLAPATVTQSRARHILLRVGGQMSETGARERLTELRRRIAAKQVDFAAAAKENSQDGSAKEGGDLGWANPGQFVPEFEEVMNSLAPGEVSQPLVSRFGVHLIQLVERRNSALSEREQREVARGILREKKSQEAYVSWAQEVRARAYVEMREPPR